MEQSVNLNDFIDAFRQAGREESYSYDGKVALFNYFEEYEESSGQEIELDIIAICCDFTQYENLKELQSEYKDIESFDDLESNTLVLYCGKYQDEESSFIIQNF